MTFFGHDVSSYNPGYQPSANEFVVVKATEGAHTKDSDWDAMSARVKRAGAILVAYHFLHSDSSAQAQADLTASVVPRGVPIMVDVETEGGSRPSVATCAAYVDACRAHGLLVRLVYFPKWYWQSVGSPSLQPLIDRKLGLVSSAYPGGSGYGGDSGSGWNGYGGMTPVIWQYSDTPLDEDAFRGTRAQLLALLGYTAPAPVPTPTPAPKPVPTPVIVPKEIDMIIAYVENNPKKLNGAVWPGDFLLWGGKLSHIATEADLAQFVAAGLPHVNMSWEMYLSLTAGH